jgi:hypothetical protein
MVFYTENTAIGHAWAGRFQKTGLELNEDIININMAAED